MNVERIPLHHILRNEVAEALSAIGENRAEPINSLASKSSDTVEPFQNYHLRSPGVKHCVTTTEAYYLGALQALRLIGKDELLSMDDRIKLARRTMLTCKAYLKGRVDV